MCLALWNLRGIRLKRTVFFDRARFKLKTSASETDALDRYAPLLGCGHVKFPPIGHLSTKSTVERILLTYLRTLLTYRKLLFADELWTLEKNKGHFIIPEFNSSIKKLPLFFSKVHSLSAKGNL